MPRMRGQGGAARAKEDQSWWISVVGLCLFIGCLSFKPSEPYLTEYLTCAYDTSTSYCAALSDVNSCAGSAPPCQWSVEQHACQVVPCSNVSLSDCAAGTLYTYCSLDISSTHCKETRCYKHFTEDQVNNDIYPWSTYAYLPFLFTLGPFAEIFSYRAAILFGILGRVLTRVLLLYGESLTAMQLMQVAYSLGSAAEDVFSAYVYYVVPLETYQDATSVIKAAQLVASVLAGILGDALVVKAHASLKTLMWISASFVWTGFAIGLFVIKPSHKKIRHEAASVMKTAVDSASGSPAAAATSSNDARKKKKKAKSKRRPKIPSSVANEYGSVSGFGGRDVQLSDIDVIDFSATTDLDVEESAQTENNATLTSSSISASSNGSMQASYGNGTFAANMTRNTSEASENISSSPEPTEVPNVKSSKLHTFRRQLHFLRRALESRPLLAMLSLWIIGNSVFTTLYGYEVSIFLELNNGSNDWNGSVLAGMLLFGCLGAVLPAYHHQQSCIPCSSANIQCCSRLTGHHRPGEERVSHGHGRVPTQADSSRLESETVVCLRLALAALLCSAALLLFVSSWSLVPSLIFLALFICAWTYISVVVFARFAAHLKLAKEKEKEVGVNIPGESNAFSPLQSLPLTMLNDFLDTRIEEEEVQYHQSDRNSKFSPKISLEGSYDNNGIRLSQGRDIEMTRFSVPQQDEDSSRRTSEDLERANEEVDPPFSFAIVCIIGCNVIAQVVLQAILFSGLQTSLWFACWCFVMLFVAATGLYVLFVTYWFGLSTFRSELRKWYYLNNSTGTR